MKIEVRNPTDSVTLDAGSFVHAWLRYHSIPSSAPLPPFDLFEQACALGATVRVSQHVYFAAPFSPQLRDYLDFAERIERPVGAGLEWMETAWDWTNHVTETPNSVPAKTLRRLQNKRLWLVGMGAVETKPGPATGHLRILLRQLNNTQARFASLCAGERDANAAREVTAGDATYGRHLAFLLIGDPALIPPGRTPDLCGAAVSCDLTGIDLRGADLRGADLSRAMHLGHAKVSGAWFDATTVFPKGAHKERAEMVCASPVGEPVLPVDLPVNYHEGICEVDGP